MKFSVEAYKYTYEPYDLVHIAFIWAKERHVERKKHIKGKCYRKRKGGKVLTLETGRHKFSLRHLLAE